MRVKGQASTVSSKRFADDRRQTTDDYSMADLSFLRRVDLRELDTFVVKKDLHLIEQKLVRVRIRNIKPEMIYELLLFLLPFGPAIFTDLGTDLLPELGRYRRNAKRFAFVAALGALKFVTSK